MKRNASYRLLLLVILPVIISAGDTASPFYDFHGESPGTVHKITVNDLPAPNATPSGVASPEPEQRPANATLKTLPGFKVSLFASGLDNPRELRAAPSQALVLRPMPDFVPAQEADNPLRDRARSKG